MVIFKLTEDLDNSTTKESWVEKKKKKKNQKGINKLVKKCNFKKTI